MIAGLRDYQERAILDVYTWMSKYKGNPCIVAPTGSGKSWIIAGMCEDIPKRWPETDHILVLSHVKELLEQDADKIRKAWPDAPLGIYSAGLGSRQINRITVAGIQSIWQKPELLGKVDVVIVDEAHLINNEETGMYRTLLSKLTRYVNGVRYDPRVIGLTATPYRLGQGMIYEGDYALFSKLLIQPVSILELVDRGYLAPLNSVLVDQIKFDEEKVRIKANGDFNEKDLASSIDDYATNMAVAKEIVERGKDRKSWLVFCIGIAHAEHMRDALSEHGINVETVTGDTPKAERQAILDDFRAGRLRAITNANVLTTGFDAPYIDLIAFCRPTLSPGLYVQMAGRGMRVAEGKKDCMVLDFAGNIARHNPITQVIPPAKGQQNEKQTTKKCPRCEHINSINAQECWFCGYVWPKQDPRSWNPKLNKDLDIMGRVTPQNDVVSPVSGWYWRVQCSKKNGKPMLVGTYETGGLAGTTIREYLVLVHGGYAEKKAWRHLYDILNGCGALVPYPRIMDVSEVDVPELQMIANILNSFTPPKSIVWHKNRNGYAQIISYEWEEVA